jgi:hypothetical protein
MINVRECGAIGDGKVDDTVAIQRAFDSAALPRAQTVFFPCGEYLVTGTIHLPHLVSMAGEAIGYRLSNEAPVHIKHRPTTECSLFALDYDKGARPYREGGTYERIHCTGFRKTKYLFDLEQSSYTTFDSFYLGGASPTEAPLALIHLQDAMLNVFRRGKMLNATDALVKYSTGKHSSTQQHFYSCYFSGVQTPWGILSEDLGALLSLEHCAIESTQNGISLGHACWLTGIGLTLEAIKHIGIRGHGSDVGLYGSSIRAATPFDLTETTMQLFGSTPQPSLVVA